MPSITLKLFKEASRKLGYYIPYFILEKKNKKTLSTTTGTHWTVDR